MRGLAVSDAWLGAPADDAASDWRVLCMDAVGDVIEFWGFKRNHGRLWAFLFLDGQPRTAGELGTALGLSKGAVSMITRELERWRVIGRVRDSGEGSWRFFAQTDLLSMVSRVLVEREQSFIARVRHDLVRAERLAREEGVADPVLARIRRLRGVADAMHGALEAFVRSARFDLRGTFERLKGLLQDGLQDGLQERRSPAVRPPVSTPAHVDDGGSPRARSRAGRRK